MRRWQVLLTAAGALGVIGWGVYKTGWFSKDSAKALFGRPGQVQTTAPMDTPSGWRYRQNQPHHWRYIMLQN
jgi:hypothetical protein